MCQMLLLCPEDCAPQFQLVKKRQLLWRLVVASFFVLASWMSLRSLRLSLALQSLQSASMIPTSKQRRFNFAQMHLDNLLSYLHLDVDFAALGSKGNVTMRDPKLAATINCASFLCPLTGSHCTDLIQYDLTLENVQGAFVERQATPLLIIIASSERSLSGQRGC